MSEYRSAPHFLVVSQEGDDLSWDLHHPESCERTDPPPKDNYIATTFRSNTLGEK